MNKKIYVAIQQIKGNQPKSFMKLALPMSAEEIERYRGKRRPLDEKWMKSNGYKAIGGQWATSFVQEVQIKNNALLLKTENSTYQAIPSF